MAEVAETVAPESDQYVGPEEPSAGQIGTSPDTAPVPETVAPAAEAPPAPKHSAHLVEQAIRLKIPAAEIEEMAPKELERAVAQLNRFGQHVWDLATKERKPEEKQVTDEFQLDFGKDETGKPYDPAEINPAIVNALKSIKREADAKVREVTQRMEQAEAARDVTGRLSGLIGELGENAKAFDRSTPKGSENWSELMATMAALHGSAKSIGKSLSEKELFSRAVKAMDIVPAAKPSQKEIDEAAKKSAWDKAALSKAETRSVDETAEQRVGRILQEIRKGAHAEPEPETDWLE